MILAIDPGTEKSAFVVFDGNEKTIIDKGIVDNMDMIEVVEKADDMEFAIEIIASYGLPVGKEVFDTCIWIGRFVQMAIDRHSIVPQRVYRKDVKMHLCGNTRAKDANIRQALIDLLGKDKTKGVSKDMWAALGVAVTVAGIQ